jgi:competence protein ComEA
MKEWWKIAFGVLCGLLGAGLILLVARQPRGEAIRLLPPPTPAPLIVHVDGAVAQPGVYTLEAGSRVQDAIQVAGGLKPEANTASLNLAATLQDGSRVLVPTLPPPVTPDVSGGAPPSRFSASPSNPVNINTASQAELESLPAIGPSLAQKIIAYRQANGPFQSIEEIMEVSGIGQKTFDLIKDLITI